MRNFAIALAASALLAGCAATGASTTGGDAATGGDKTASAEKPSVFPTKKSLSETHDAALSGRPKESDGLSVVEKRHLFARYVMESCVKNAPNYVAGLERSALQPAAKLASGARSFADRTFKVAASSNGRFCDVRALGGELDKFAEGMRVAFTSRGALESWARVGEEWRGVLVIDGARYVLRARSVRVNVGTVHAATLRRG